MPSEELIQKFFNKDCTPQEAEQVWQYLKSHPDQMSRYLAPEEWEGTEPVQMNDHYWENLWQNIEHKRKSSTVRWLKQSAVAASFLIIAFTTIYFFNRQDKNTDVAIEQQKSEPKRTVRLNTSIETITIFLPDQSAVQLAPGSFITYNDPFDTDKRDVNLQGRARFAVAKDASKPFTVIAGGLATTAVGTEFTIDTKQDRKSDITVQLHEGKVLIRQTGSTTNKWKEDIYLTSGQQLTYNSTNTETAVSAIPAPSIISKNKTTQRRKANDKDAKQSHLSFDGTPLTVVISELERHYNVKINYSSEELEGKTFTGTLSETDAVAVVLMIIAQMNHLEVNEEDGHFTLKKSND